ncbi:MAG: nickel pincer cofactor biosynthesis protein LarC [Actinomycetota bacterium]
MTSAGHRVAWFQCGAGVAGDMVLAALIDAGADQFAVMDAIGALGVADWALTFEEVQRCGVRARWANVVVHAHNNGHDHTHRPAREVLALIAAADLAPRVRDRALAVYRALATVEGGIHGMDPDDVELHEVGALDSIIDVVGVCAALESLGIDDLAYSPIAVGHGSVTTQHGVMPNPVPAVSRLLEQAGAPVVGLDTTMEVSTPTGVALMTVLGSAAGAMPPMTVTATGFGAGTKDVPQRPNVVQVVIGEVAGASPDGDDPGQAAFEVAVNVDDVTGEVLAHTVERLLTVGAFDAWVTPIVMKKGRPAHTVHALCDAAHHGVVVDTLLAETGSMGVRSTTVRRWPQRRDEVTIDVDGHPIRVKVAGHRTKLEFDDAKRAAEALGVPVREVLARAEQAARD